MPATVRINVPQWPNLADAALMREVGDLALRFIRTRTAAGKDVEGQSFQPYTPGYAERRQKEGLGTTPNLAVSGRMLNDMGILTVGPGKVTLGFRSQGGTAAKGKGLTLIQRSRSVGAADKASYHNELGAGKRRVIRKFFGLGDEETATIRQRVARYLDEWVRRVNRG